MATVDTLLQGNFLDSNQGGIAFCSVNLIEAVDDTGGLRRIIVDTGSSGRERALQDALARRGLTGADIDTVVLTHAHWDHMQNLDMFSRASFRLHPAELDYIQNPNAGDFATPRWTKAVIDRYDVREVRDGDALSPGVVILAAAGHSPGSIAVRADTASGIAVLCGDAIQNSDVAVRGRNALVFWNEAEAGRTIQRLLDAADVLYPGHDQAFQLSKTGAVHYTQDADLIITGTQRESAHIRIAERASLRVAHTT
jgi:N-acyl homoserine lactone hydrolase